MLDTKDAEIQAEIQAITNNKYMTQQQKVQRVSVLKSSKLTGTDTSAQTVVSIANTMIGSTIIVYPVLFVKDGIIGSTIIMLIIGCIQYLTCRLLVVHNRPDEPSFNQSILRIGGVKIDKLNSISNSLLLFFAATAYFLLISVNFFQISAALIEAFNNQYSPPDISSRVFNQYSIQWACIISALLCIPTLLKRQIEGILVLVKYSVYPVAAYAIFIIACLIREIVNGSIHFKQYVLFDPDFSSVAGAFALSFLIHPTASPILKRNIKLENNSRDLLLGYILTAFIYFYVGFIGGLSCASEVQNINKNPNSYTNVFDCVAKHQTTQQTIFYISGKIIQVGILFQNYSVMPVIFFLTRKQVINLTNRPKIFIGFTIFFLLFSMMVGILAIDVSIVLSFTGAIIGFFMVYFIPIWIHLKCYHHKYTKKENQKRKSLLADDSMVSQMQLDEETQKQILQCNKHKPKSKLKHYILYGGLICFGLALGIFKLMSFFIKNNKLSSP